MSRLSLGQPQTIGGVDPRGVFDVVKQSAVSGDESACTLFLQQLGARNAYPPLPHSPCLRNKKTGIVLPWNDLLAEQQEFFDCCDEDGNTDPSAWQAKVIPDEMDDAVETQILAMKQSEQRLIEQQNNQYVVPNAIDMTPKPEQYPGDIVPFDQVETLIKQMDS